MTTSDRQRPIATYRVQLTPDFDFAATIGILDHLVALGISHIYLSPIGTAMPGSTPVSYTHLTLPTKRIV